MDLAKSNRFQFDFGEISCFFNRNRNRFAKSAKSLSEINMAAPCKQCYMRSADELGRMLGWQVKTLFEASVLLN
jgi:hypothetical protein